MSGQILLCVIVVLSYGGVKVNTLEDTPLSPTFQNIPGGTYAIWQIPAQPRAILFLAHGRLHERAENFWDAVPACAVCSSLPEERLVTKAALGRGYAVISIQAGAGGSSEWSLSPDPRENQDVRMVVRFLQQWRREQRLQHLPLTVMGVSHGGSFASVLALASDLHITGMLFMVSMGEDSAVEAAQAASYPPVFYLRMPQDQASDQAILRNMQELGAKGIAVEAVVCDPLPINETFFTERIVGLEAPVSAAVYQALLEHEYLDSDGFLRPPEPGTWETEPAGNRVGGSWDFPALVESLHLLPAPVGNSEWPWVEESVAMELSLACAFHACTSLKSTEMLDWLDATWNNASSASAQTQSWAVL